MKIHRGFFVLVALLSHTLLGASFRPPFQGVVTATLMPTWFNVERKPAVDDFIGRRTVLFFWTTSCSTCQPLWQQLQAAAQGPDAPFQVIGVHSGRFEAEHDPNFVRATIRRYGIKMPVVDDGEFALWRVFGVTAWPTLVLINPDGYIVKTYSAVRSIQEVVKDVEKLKVNLKREVLPSSIVYKPEAKAVSLSPLRYPSRMILVKDFEGGVAFLISDSGNNRIVVMRPTGHIIQTIGSGEMGAKDGSFDEARFSVPNGITYRNSIAYVADTANHLIRRIDFKKKMVDTIAGNGTADFTGGPLFSTPARSVSIPSPLDVALYPEDEELAIAVGGLNQIWAYRLSTKVIRLIAGGSVEGMDDGMSTRVTLAQPSTLFATVGQLFFLDSNSSSLRFYEKGRVTTLVGQGLTAHGFENGNQTEALLQFPTALWVDSDKVYISDSYNHSIRVLDRKTNYLSTLVGRKAGFSNGKFIQATFDTPSGIVHLDDKLFICDSNNHAIRVANLKRGEVTTLGLSIGEPAAPRRAASVMKRSASRGR